MEPRPDNRLLQVHDLTVHYRSDEGVEVCVVDGASLEIGSGEVLGLLGESGCGKSTLALSLLRLLPAAGRISKGSILFGGRELLRLDERELQKVRGAEISMVSQDAGISLNPVMRAGDQVREVIRAHRPWNLQRCRDEAKTVLEQVRLSDATRIYDAYPHQLSGGQRQRIIIAQAIACRPRLIIADEPTTALDVTVQAEILDLLRGLKDQLQIALLLISHNPAILASLADRIAVMYAGRIIEEGPSAQILRNPLHPYTQGLLRSLPRARRQDPNTADRQLPPIAGHPPDFGSLPPGCPFEPRCPERMEVCKTREPNEVRPEPSRRVRCFKYGG